jgi:Ca2+-transporting ATPase
MASWHSLTAKAGLDKLKSGPNGLGEEEASQRLLQYGCNRIEKVSKASPLALFLSQFKNYLTIVLIFAALISVIAGENTNGYVILIIVVLVALIGFIQEYKAERAMDALREMVSSEADVIRDGKMISIPSEELVPGDVIYLEAGDRVPADGRIIEDTSLEVIEASLTGESLPVEKFSRPLGEETPLADRKNLVFMGTIVTHGNCRALVTATGLSTEIGRISGLIEKESEDPPLKRKLEQLAKRQALLVLMVSALIFFVNLSRGYSIIETLITSIALAVAGVPEALPFVVTLALAYGTQVMARKNAIIRRLTAVETLGSTTVICTDKTGTLTTGQTMVREIHTYRTIEITGYGYAPEGAFLYNGRDVNPEEEDLAGVLRIGILSNNANLERANGSWRIVGDPTEGALIVAAKKAGLLDDVRKDWREILEYPFDSDRKMMTTVNRSEAKGIVVAAKGAPEVLLSCCSYLFDAGGIRPMKDADRLAILASSDQMAGKALRVLAMAWKPLEEQDHYERDLVESGLIFAGLVGMIDPPRPEAMEAICVCKQAGIRPVMITGDHRLTAKAIAGELGIGNGDVIEGIELEKMSDEELAARIEEVSVFARVTAEHKVRIVEALRKQGHVVAMTGDGVNDAPALTAADIGVAMGRTGTEVAKEAADMVIADDNFATIVAAVEEGRRIYNNIRKATSYLLSVSFAEVATIFLGVMMGLPVPLLAVQILWINVVAEEFPAIGLSTEPVHAKIMCKSPRNPREPLLSAGLTIYTLGVAAAVVAGTLGLYIIALQSGESLSYARTMAFVGLGFFTVFNSYSSRFLDESVLKMNPLSNKKLILGIAASVTTVFAAIYLPFLQSIFGTEPLRIDSWLSIIIACGLVILAAEILKKLVPGLGD